MDKSDIKFHAIDTRYKGYFFRSRLEARWAVFMDTLGIKWEYEAEGYNLDGLWYLPDFYLPTFDGGSYLEVKGQKLNNTELEKVYRLCLLSGKNVIFGVGVPDYICQEYLYLDVCNGVKKVMQCHGLMNADQAYDENRMFSLPGYENSDLSISQDYYDRVGEMYYRAVENAKGARF